MSHNPGRFLLPLSAFAATARDTLSRLPLRGWLSADSLISLGTLAGGFLSVRLCMDSADVHRQEHHKKQGEAHAFQGSGAPGACFIKFFHTVLVD